MLLSEFGWIPWIAHHLGFHMHGYVDLWTALVVVLLLTTMAVIVWRRVRAPQAYVVPDGNISITNFFDVAVEAVAGMMDDVIGPNGRRYLPLIGTVFFYILFSNLIGLIPGMGSPTTSFSMNLTIAAVVFVTYHYLGIRAHGVANYLKHFMGPMLFIAPLIFTIEIVSHMFRPLTLSLRLLGNMSADHSVLAAFTEVVPLGVPIIFLAFGTFVCLVQAFVFSLLSMVYIALAEAHMEEGH